MADILCPECGFPMPNAGYPLGPMCWHCKEEKGGGRDD